MKFNRASRRYYKEIKTIIPSIGKYEKRLLKNYKDRITELNVNNPKITYYELQKNLGNPAEIINNYYENVDTVYLIKRLKTTKMIRACLLTILLIVLISIAICLTIDIKMHIDIENAIPTHKEVIID